MINPQDDALRRTSLAAQRYEVGEELIARAAERMADAGISMYVYTAGYLHAQLLEVAEVHKAECDKGVCSTCDTIGQIVAVLLAFACAELDDEFRRQLKLPVPAAAKRGWRRLFGR